MKLFSVFSDYASIVSVTSTLLLVALSGFLVKLYYARSMFLKLRRQGLPMPPWNPVWGHLAFVHMITSQLPKDAHPGYMSDHIRQALPQLGPVYYLDLWPFGPQMLLVGSPSSLYQVTQEHSLPKYHDLKLFLQPITDGLDIVTMEGEAWKKWRRIFNPGYSAGHLMTMTSAIVEETSKFCDILQSYVQSQKIFRMKDLADYLALDVIGRVVLDTQLDSQRKSNPLVAGLRMQIRWLVFGANFNPLSHLVYRYNKWRMDGFVSRELDSRIAQFHTSKPTKSIMDLALNAYFSESSGSEITGGMDSTFKKFAMSQIKLFLFSGHDTTSGSVCYLFYILSLHSSALSRVRDEHDQIFGSSVEKATDLIAQSPFLLNQLPYTTAVIKETLRLYPPVSSTRAGEPGFNVKDDQGRQFPTDGFLVWANPQVVQRDPAYWPQPDEFVPERWLAPPDSPLHPVKGAWRPFEFGPRNCIGQELAMIEMKVILVLALRRFDIKPAYDELDKRQQGRKINTVYGQRGYQIQRAQPSDNLPCRVYELQR